MEVIVRRLDVKYTESHSVSNVSSIKQLSDYKVAIILDDGSRVFVTLNGYTELIVR